MRIDRDQVERLARLSALDLGDDGGARLAADLTRILERFEPLRLIPEGLLPPLPEPRPVVLRQDVPAAGPAVPAVVAGNAPRFPGRRFAVPRVVPRRG